jgi:ankyrin repeat domain-containing protein 13
LVKIGLRCRGRTISRSNHLQRAVFENNLSLISRLLSTQQAGIFYIEKNELDARDNSALTLAVKLQNLDAIKILTDAYCSAKLSAAPQLPSAYELACSIQHEAILQILIASALKLKQYFMDLHKEQIFRTLEQLPDFSIDLHFECASSYIPFLNYVSPSDTYKIYKKGTNLRLDMTLIGFRKL